MKDYHMWMGACKMQEMLEKARSEGRKHISRLRTTLLPSHQGG